MGKAAVHPLDPLTAEEIRQCAQACKDHGAGAGIRDLRFNVISLKEPEKAALLKHGRDSSVVPARLAHCILQVPGKGAVYVAILQLHAGGPAKVLAWDQKEGVQPLASPDDCFDAEAIAKADQTVQARLGLYGITDMDLVACDPWSVHNPPCKGRLIQCFMYMRSSPNDNHYAHPLDFVAVVDLNQRKVVRIDAPYGDRVPKMPAQDWNYHRDLVRETRTDVKPLNVVQPEGPSFQVTGNLIEWQCWKIRMSFNYREGVVLHDVGYEDEGRVRPVMHRGSLVEMAVPYGDPCEPFNRKCAFDVGDYGLGFCANSLELGCDCLGHIQYFDAVLNDSKGEPTEIKKAVCLHEEDAGLLWKHMDYRSGHAESRRSRRLVISFISTVVNYEYAFYWSFYQDGTIKYEIKLTGELSTNLPNPEEGALSPYGTMVLPGVNAQHHQHMFCARLDMAVDDAEGGRGLLVTEVEAQAMSKGPKNPHGNAFTSKETELQTESEAQRTADSSTGRVWLVKNPSRLHPYSGKPAAYKLVPTAAPTLLATDDSLIAIRGGFSRKNLWVTPYRPAESFPSGDWVLQSMGGDGLEAWTKKDRQVGPGSDPVLWHCFGMTHFVRPEDFPIMPMETTGFTLKPIGFFKGNPSLDLPWESNKASKLCGCSPVTAPQNGHANGLNGHGIGHTNGHSNGHADGHANGHANGNGVAH